MRRKMTLSIVLESILREKGKEEGRVWMMDGLKKGRYKRKNKGTYGDNSGIKDLPTSREPWNYNYKKCLI